MATHLSQKELLAGLSEIRQSPSDAGTIEMIVARPEENQREVLEEALLDVDSGLSGDNWQVRGSSRTTDGSAPPEKQLTLMNSRCIHLIAGSKSRWPLAGDQLFVDLDLSEENLPPGTRLQVGEGLIEITPAPHNGCKKFANRFGVESVRFVNSPEGKALHLRGLNAKILRSGKIRPGDQVHKV